MAKNNRACPKGCRCDDVDDCPLGDDDGEGEGTTPRELEGNEKKYKHIMKKIKEGRMVL